MLELEKRMRDDFMRFLLFKENYCALSITETGFEIASIEIRGTIIYTGNEFDRIDERQEWFYATIASVWRGRFRAACGYQPRVRQ